MARSPQQVLADHGAAIESGDIDRIMADYADDCIVLVPDGASVGKEAIRGLFESLLESFANMRLTTTTTVVEGDTLLTVWSAEFDAGAIPQGVDTFIIRDDKIQRQTAWFTVVPKEA